jgi:hypothetical protein
MLVSPIACAVNPVRLAGTLNANSSPPHHRYPEIASDNYTCKEQRGTSICASVHLDKPSIFSGVGNGNAEST